MKLLISFLLLFLTNPLGAQSLYKQLSDEEFFTQESIHTRFRLSYENIPLANSKPLGVVGTHYDIFPSKEYDLFYAGFGFFNALSGEDGGFFTFGYTMGIDYEFYKNLHLDGGIYFGGGSGEYIGFDNGGLMVRTHLGLSYELDTLAFTLGVSRTSFPNTSKNKNYENDIHPYIGLNIKDDIWGSLGKSKYTKTSHLFDGLFQKIRITPAMVYYDIDDKKTKRTKYYSADELYQENFPMLGIQLERFLSESVFVSMEAYGALHSAAGYAAIEAGLGYEYRFSDLVSWESKMVVGSAGDGRIDTAGGFVLQPMTGLRYTLSPHYSLKALVGRTYAPGGTFSSTTYEAGLSFTPTRAVPKSGRYFFKKSNFEKLRWLFSPSYKHYFPYSSSHKGSAKDSSKEVGLVGVSLAVALNDYVSILGSTHWAATGNVGSYAEGLFGLKLSSGEFSPLKLKVVLQGEIGAGAGGSINTSSGGYVTQLLAGLELPTSKHTSLGIYGGDMHTSDGRFRAKTFELSLNMHLDFFYEK